MTEARKQYLSAVEKHGVDNGWVQPLTEEEKDFFAYFRSVCKRYNITPSKATRMEYDFVTRVAESEFSAPARCEFSAPDPNTDPIQKMSERKRRTM